MFLENQINVQKKKKKKKEKHIYEEIKAAAEKGILTYTA